MLKIIQKPVQNYTLGRKNYKIEGVVIHIGDGSQKNIFGKYSANSFGTFLTEEKSAHYSVDLDGVIWQFVNEKDTAWHCGIVKNPTSDIIKEWRAKDPLFNPNYAFLGIEHAGFGGQDITEVQYSATAELLYEISQRHKIPLDRIHIIGHSEIRNDKVCPGKIDLGKLIKLAQNFPLKKEAEEKKKIEELKIQISLLQRLVGLWRQLLNLKRFGNMEKGFSLTQGGILVAVAGTLLTQYFSEGCSKELTTNIPLIIGAVVAWVGRYRKGDITFAGFKK